MALQLFLAFAFISLSISAHGEESPGEAYWKMNLGNDISMPKVVKDGLLGTGISKNYQANNDQFNRQQLSKVITNRGNQEYTAVDGQAYAQQLLKTKTNRGNQEYNTYSAQSYAQPSEVQNNRGNQEYTNGAQTYAQQLLGTKTNRGNQEYSANSAQAYAHQLSSTQNNRGNQEYTKSAKTYAQQLSGTKTNRGNQEYSANSAQAYAQKLSETQNNRGNQDYTNGAQTYAQQLLRTKTNKGNQEYNANEAQATSHTLSKITTNRGNQEYTAKSSEPITDDSILYFFEKELVHPGSKMKLHFLMGAQEAKFMPTQVANSIPFSYNKLPQILQFFAVKPGTTNAKIIEESIKRCESKPMKGEEKYCATSLEAMVKYVKSRLGNQVKALSTEVDKETKQEYKIESAKKVKNENNLVCHKMVYPYAVFYCHTLSKTDAYQVSLTDNIGKKVKAIAVCHKDTSPWNPAHLAFQLLKVKPGSVPICHFLNVDTMIWVPK